jgi:hypothetical protein
MEWQPIETAPEAFIDVLLWDGGFDFGLGLGFLSEEGDWILKCRVNSVPYEGALETVYPTHWMHLPKPPES